MHGHRLSVRFRRALPRARRDRAGRPLRLRDGGARAQARYLHRQRHHRMGSVPPAHLQFRHHARSQGRGRDPLPQAISRHPRPELVRLRRARMPGRRHRPGTHRAADLLRRTHPGNRPQPRAAGRRDHRRHGELLRHGPGRHVGPGTFLRERRLAGGRDQGRLRALDLLSRRQHDRGPEGPRRRQDALRPSRRDRRRRGSRTGARQVDLRRQRQVRRSAARDLRHPGRELSGHAGGRDRPRADRAGARGEQGGRRADPRDGRRERRRRVRDARSCRQARRQGSDAPGIRPDRHLGAGRRRTPRAPPTSRPPTSPPPRPSRSATAASSRCPPSSARPATFSPLPFSSARMAPRSAAIARRI